MKLNMKKIIYRIQFRFEDSGEKILNFVVLLKDNVLQISESKDLETKILT